MKKLVILPNDSSAGHFKFMVHNGNKIKPTEIYTKNNSVILSFNPNFTTDPVYNTKIATDIFVKRDEQRKTRPGIFHSLNNLNTDAYEAEKLQEILDYSEKNHPIDIWLDVKTISRINAVFLIKAITDINPTLAGRVNLYAYPHSIAEQSTETWQPALVKATEVTPHLVEKNNAIWHALTSDTPELAAEIFSQEGADEWTAQLLKRFLEELPERQSHLTRSERELLTIVNDATGLRFIDLCGLHHAKFNDDFINWMEIPAFLDRLEIKGLIEYGNRQDHSNLKEIVEKNIHDDFYAYHNVEIRITDKGRNVISGSRTAPQKTSESETSTLSESETPWLWDENEMRVVRAFHPSDK